MKTMVLSVLAAALLATGCAPTAPPITDPPPEMLHSAQAVIRPANLSYVVQSYLNCGCPFIIGIDEKGGDPAISYAIPTIADQIASHNINVTADTTGLASGTYTAYLAIRTPDPRVGFLRDTLRDTLIIP